MTFDVGNDCSVMDRIAENGDTKLLDWFLENTDYLECSNQASFVAIKNKNLQVLQWLHENYMMADVNDCIEFALKHEVFSVIKWICTETNLNIEIKWEYHFKKIIKNDSPGEYLEFFIKCYIESLSDYSAISGQINSTKKLNSMKLKLATIQE